MSQGELYHIVRLNKGLKVSSTTKSGSTRVSRWEPGNSPHSLCLGYGWLFPVENLSSRKITAVKQPGPRGCSSYKYCKIPGVDNRGLQYMLLGKKKEKKTFLSGLRILVILNRPGSYFSHRKIGILQYLRYVLKKKPCYLPTTICPQTKKEKVSTLRDLNSEAEKKKSFGEMITEDFQRK